MRDKFNNQFATQKLRTEISATSGPGSATFTAGTGEQTAPRATKKIVKKKIKEGASSEFIANKVWDFLETRPFANPNYMPQFNTAKEIYDEFGPKELELYSNFDWKGDSSKIHPREKEVLDRRATYDALSKGSVTEADVEPKLAAGKAKVYMKNKWGWKDAPSIPNRPSKGGFQYKQLFEMKVSDLELDYPEFAGVVEYVADYLGLDIRAVYNADIKNASEDYFEIVNIPGEEGKSVFVDIARAGQGPKQILHLNITTSGPTYSNVANTTMQLEENYSRFKKETKTRTNEQQIHAAMRLAEKKIHEANRILEYTTQLRTELNETRVNKNTQRLMEKITRGIAEAYGKMKKLK